MRNFKQVLCSHSPPLTTLYPGFHFQYDGNTLQNVGEESSERKRVKSPDLSVKMGALQVPDRDSFRTTMDNSVEACCAL